MLRRPPPVCSPSGCRPGIVGTHVPEMPFGIPAGEGSPSVALIRDVEDHLRAGRLRHGINSVSVGGDQAGALRIRHSDLVWLLNVLAIFRLAAWLYHGTEHD